MEERYTFLLILIAVFICFVCLVSASSYDSKIEEMTTAATEETMAVAPTNSTETNDTIEPTIKIIEETEPVEELTYSIDTPQTDLELLACVIYREAGGDASCDNCRYYVGDVVLNRVESGYWGDTIYDVLTAPSQYGTFSVDGVNWGPNAGNECERHAVERAYKVAKDLLDGNHSELYGKNYLCQAEFVQGNGGFWCCGMYYGYI